MSSQAPGIGITNVIDPAFDRGVKLGEGDFPGAVFIPAQMKTAREFDYVARFDPAMRRKHDKTQLRNAVCAGDDLCRSFMDGQPQPVQKFDDRLFPFVQLAFAVAEQCEIVHVAQIRRALQPLSYKQIQRRQVNVAHAAERPQA